MGSFPVAMVALTVVDITLGRVEEALRNMEPNARTMTSLVQMVHSAANTLRLRASRDVTDASDDEESSDPDPSPPAHHATSEEPTNLTKPAEVLQKFTVVEDVSANEVAKKQEASTVDLPTTPKTPTTIYSLLSQVRSEEVNTPTVTEDIKKVAAVKEVFATEVVQHEEESKVDKQTTPKTPTTNSLTKWFLRKGLGSVLKNLTSPPWRKLSKLQRLKLKGQRRWTDQGRFPESWRMPLMSPQKRPSLKILQRLKHQQHQKRQPPTF